MATNRRQTFTVFYSWQSDLEGRANRSLIEDALERAAKTLRADESLQVEPVMDRDTAGKAGSPDIAATIFGKIDVADAFVADVSFITPATPEHPKRNAVQIQTCSSNSDMRCIDTVGSACCSCSTSTTAR
jgi:hypothetical protein